MIDGMVTRWEDRGSRTEPWEPNCLYLLHHDGPLVVRAGYNPSLMSFQVLITHNGFDLVKQEHDRADEALAQCQRYVDERLPSRWLWVLVNDQSEGLRPARVTTRGHEGVGGSGRYAA